MHTLTENSINFILNLYILTSYCRMMDLFCILLRYRKTVKHTIIDINTLKYINYIFNKALSLTALHRLGNIIGYYRYSRRSKCPFALIVAVIIGLSTALKAAVITGYVTSERYDKPLDCVSVQVESSSFGASTNPEGFFQISDVPSGEWIVNVSHIGMEPMSKTVYCSMEDTVSVAFSLVESAVALEEVVYTATRTFQALKSVPIATELISRDEIFNSSAITAAEALESEIGLDMQEDFSGQGVTLQGVDADKVLILVDGNRIIGRVNGSIDLEQIATDGIKQIEVVKGAVSTLYGSEAIGGVINIITEDPSEQLSISADIRGGGYLPDKGYDNSSQIALESENYSAGASLGMKKYKLGIRASARGSRTGLIDIDPSTSHTEGIDGTDRFNGNLRLNYELTGLTSLIVDGRYLNEEKHWKEDGGLSSVQVSFNDEENNSQTGFVTELLCQPTYTDRYSLKLYRTDNRHIWKKKTQHLGRTIDFSSGEEGYFETSGLLTKRLNDLHLTTFGAEHYWWDISAESELGGITSLYSSGLTAWATYLQDEWKIHEDITLLPGLRYEQHEIYGGNLSPRFSFMWLPIDDFKVRGSVGKGYRAPTSKELYFVFNHASAGYVVYGNSDLKAEESTNYSLSFEHTYRNSSVARISFFYNELKNLIDFDSISATPDYYTGIYQYKNIDSAYTRGVEIERGFKYAGKWQGKVAYGYLETHNWVTGTELIRRPTHSLRWDVTWQPEDWTFKVWGRYIDKMLFVSIWQTDDRRSDEWTNAYQLWNFTIARHFDNNLDTYMKVTNLFDYTHPRYGPRSGRVLTMGLRWNFVQKE